MAHYLVHRKAYISSVCCTVADNDTVIGSNLAIKLPMGWYFSSTLGFLHVLVSGRVQLRHHETHARPQPQHRRSGLQGSAVCGKGDKIIILSYCQNIVSVVSWQLIDMPFINVTQQKIAIIFNKNTLLSIHWLEIDYWTMSRM